MVYKEVHFAGANGDDNMKASMATALTLLLVAIAPAAETTRYTALVNGGNDKAGHLAVTRDGDHFTIDFLFKDNGRGPELKEEFTLDRDGTFESYLVKGVSTNGGNDKAGHLAVTRDGDHFTIDFLFKDNGRGPELKEEFTLDRDGTFESYLVKGVSTFGSLVDETFTRSGAKASWKTTA